MKIERKINNSIAVTRIEDGTEAIVMGKGIVYGKEIGAQIPENLIEKTFILSSTEYGKQFEKIISDIPEKYMETVNEIVNYALETAGLLLDDTIYISLADHLNMSIQRHLSGIAIPNMIIWDIKRFYPLEYKVGLEALNIIEKRLKVTLPEDESGYIAFHLVNAETESREFQSQNILGIIKEIINLVRYTLEIDFNEDDFYYQRFLTHCKFFAQRIVQGNHDSGKESMNFLKLAGEEFSESLSCVETIEKFLRKKYQYEIVENEKLYLTLHITNLIKNSTK